MKIDRTSIFLLLTIFLCGCAGQLPEPSQTIALSPTQENISTPAIPTPTEENTPTLAIPTPTAERVNITTSGEIIQDEIWRGEIHITGDIHITNNATLTIEPGTIVYFAPNSDDQHLGGGDFNDEYTSSHNDPVRLASWTHNAISINDIDGTIVAVGTPDQKIVFRPEGDNTSPAQWDGIVIRRGTIQYATLLYAGGVGINVWQPFEPVEIAHNEIRFTHWCGINGDSGGAWIHHNLVEGGGHQGINCTGNCTAEHNIVLAAQTGISIEGGDDTIIRNNIVVNSGVGIVLRYGQGKVEIANNTIVRTGELPDGFYYQGQLIYPFGEAGNDGIAAVGEGQINVVNNIVAGPVTCAYGVHVFPATGSQFDYNLTWGQQYIPCGEATSIFGAHILSADPLFVDILNMDFHLLPDSPAINAGTPELLDADGSPSDLGAYGGPQGAGW